ncbi:MAG: lysine--tRNA ligase, partial [Bdellovibrionales bacterium]|nr:lysine--tRNA ligase [Bdellovibrionales bacterium]
AGMELGNAYTELNDPEDQFERLKEQEALRQVDEEAQPMDLDFVHAIDVGMPPTGGVGLGVERLVMLLTDQASIRDILFFPTMKHR